MYVTGYGNHISDLFNAIHDTLIQVGWTAHQISKNTVGDIDGCIYEGVGDGTDKIYIYLSYHNNEDRLILDSGAGYDEHLGAFEQPGSIQQWLKDDCQHPSDTPQFVISNNERFFYWLFVDTYRVICVTRMSIVYESFYVGFLNPIANERQYPYPMYVCGNTHATGSAWPNNLNGSFVFPQNNQGWLRRADGTWRAFDASKPNPDPASEGTVFPYNAHNQKLVPNYKETDAINQDNFLIIPIMLCTNDPVDINGLLRGCYWVSGTRDIDAERVLVYGGDQYIVFDTKQDRGANTYFCIKME